MVVEVYGWLKTKFQPLFGAIIFQNCAHIHYNNHLWTQAAENVNGLHNMFEVHVALFLAM